jgi:Spy/CpxP family protein refolding chaperone
MTVRFLSFVSAAGLIAALACPSNALAQSAAPAASPATQSCGTGGGANPMQGIQLTPAQRAQIKQIHEQFRAQYPCGSKPPAQARQAMRAQVMNVLTPAQRAQYQANLQSEQTTHSPPPN